MLLLAAVEKQKEVRCLLANLGGVMVKLYEINRLYFILKLTNVEFEMSPPHNWYGELSSLRNSRPILHP